ncbi:MAG: hypothetical protein KGR98_13530, partial [Verrucomicrobia bacterium]|nr:hypothetical protein [Verrucomicrobiota bacterium]
PLMLLMLHLLALGVLTAMFIGMFLLHRRAHRARQAVRGPVPHPLSPPRRPGLWLAVRSSDRRSVQSALAAGELAPALRANPSRWRVAPPVNGWTMVTGPDLPNPSADVDDCFRFLLALSRRLGHVQFFYSENVLHHHAWARLDDGCVTRAYAWAGETIWNQGLKTIAEIQLELRCFQYGESVGAWEASGAAAQNVERIPLLAARWSIDPCRTAASFPIRGSDDSGVV